jgi:predicted aspartyl protease
MLFPRPCRGSEADDLITRAVEAHGGAEAIEKAETTGKRAGTFTQFFPAPNSGSFVEWKKGDMVRMRVQLAGFEILQGYDGERAWMKSFGQVIDAPDQVQTAIEGELRHNFTLLIESPGEDYSVETAEPDTLPDGGTAPGVTIVPADGSPSTSFHFDAETGRVVKMAFTDVNPFKGGEAHFESYFLEYASSGGIPYPSKVIHYIDGVQLDEVIYESVDFDAVIEDEAFVKPGAEKEAAPGVARTTIPLEYAMNMLFIEVGINDSDEPSSFIVDTGAGLTCISYEAADEFDIETHGDMSAAGAGGALKVKTAYLDSLILGELTVEVLEVMVIDIATMGEMMGRRIDGILGYNVLNRFATTIDIAGGSMTFADPDAPLPESEGSVTMPFQVLMGVPVVKGVVDGTAEVDFLVDTGAAVSVLPRPIADELEPESVLEGAMAAGADARPIEMTLARFTELALDGITVPEPVFSSPTGSPKEDPLGSTIDTGTRGVLGTAILGNFRLTLNYDTATLHLDPVESPPEKELEWCGPGLGIYKEKGIVTVKTIYGGSPADGVVLPGDKILEIDGVDLAELPLSEVIRLLRGKPGSSVELLIERDDERETFKLKRVKLL